MAIAFYILTLGISATFVGSFTNNMLGELGFAPTFQTGVRLAIGAACAYMALQFAWMALIQGLKPTRSSKYLLAESLSHLTAIALTPYLLHLEIPWPDPALAKVEALVFLGAFVGLHAATKLFAFYSALYAPHAPRYPALVWLGLGFVSITACSYSLQQWHSDLENARPQAETTMNTYRIGETYGDAYEIQEGTMASYEIPLYAGRALTLRCANPPKADSDSTSSRAYFTVWFHGAETERYQDSTRLQSSGWSTVHIPSEEIPVDATHCSIFWSSQKPPTWTKIITLTPVVTSHRTLLISEPLHHEVRNEFTPPNVIIIGIDGLNTDHISGWGYEKRTTPKLDRLAKSSVTFPYTYSSSTEAPAAYMSLFAGVNPLCHGYLGKQQGPLPTSWQAFAELMRNNHYATAAFTQNENGGGLEYGSGFERGFDWYDPSFTIADEEADSSAGTRLSVDNALNWINEHKNLKYMLFLRASELSNSELWDTSDEEKDIDQYDAALSNIDASIGELTQFVLNSELSANTCIVVISPYGIAFTSKGAVAQEELGDEALRVPLFYYQPELSPEERTYFVSLEDIQAALLKVAELETEVNADSSTFLMGPLHKDPVSMQANPFAISVRSGNWRYAWQPEGDPFVEMPTLNDGSSKLYKVGKTIREVKIGSEQESMVADFKQRLLEYIEGSISWRDSLLETDTE